MWTWSTLMQQWQFVHCPEHLSRWPWAIKQSLLSSPVTLLEETASLSTRLLLHFLLDSIAVVGGVTAAINWGLLFSLFSITVLFWTLLVWFPLCRNKAGQNTYFIFLRVTPILYMLLKYTWPLQHHATTTICQATIEAVTTEAPSNTKSHLVGKFSSWPSMQSCNQLREGSNAEVPSRGRLPSCNPVVMHFKHASFSTSTAKGYQISVDRY